MRLSEIIISLLLAMSHVLAQETVTVYGVVEPDDDPNPDEGTSIVSVLGTGADGATTYLAIEYEGDETTISQPTITQVITVPTPEATLTIAADATRAIIRSLDRLYSCSIGDVTGVCFEMVATGTTISTTEETVTGIRTPIATYIRQAGTETISSESNLIDAPVPTMFSNSISNDAQLPPTTTDSAFLPPTSSLSQARSLDIPLRGLGLSFFISVLSMLYLSPLH